MGSRATKTGSDRVEFQKLFTVTQTTPAALEKKITSTTRLDSGVSAEILWMVARAPLDANGDGESAEWVQPVVDGKTYDGGDKLLSRIDLDSSQAFEPEKLSIEKAVGPVPSKGVMSHYGLGLPDLIGLVENDRTGQAILQNTTVKVKPGGKIAAEYQIGNSALTDNLIIEFWGYLYHTETALEQMMARIYGRSYNLRFFDKNALRTISLQYPARPADVKEWPKLIGGQDQEGKGGSDIIVRKILRWARNKGATTPNKRFTLDHEVSQVVDDFNNMKFDVDDDELLIINKIGVLGHANHQDTFIVVNEKDIQALPTSSTNNPWIFGRDTGKGAAVKWENHRFKPLRTLNPVFIHGETGKIEILDTGTAIADGTNFDAGSLVVIEMLSLQSKLLENQ